MSPTLILRVFIVGNEGGGFEFYSNTKRNNVGTTIKLVCIIATSVHKIPHHRHVCRPRISSSEP